MAKPVGAMPSVLPELPAGLETLPQLALDLLVGARPAVGRGWRQLDAELWDATRKPWLMLQTVPRSARVHGDPLVAVP